MRVNLLARILLKFLIIFSSSESPNFWTLILFSLRQISHMLVFLISSIISSQSLYNYSQLFFSLQHLYSLHYYFVYFAHWLSIYDSYSFAKRSFRPGPNIFIIYFTQVSVVMLVFFSSFYVLLRLHFDQRNSPKYKRDTKMKGSTVQRTYMTTILRVKQKIAAFTTITTANNTQIILLLLSIFLRFPFYFSSLTVSLFLVVYASLTVSRRCVNFFSYEIRPKKKKTHRVSTIDSSSKNSFLQTSVAIYLSWVRQTCRCSM